MDKETEIKLRALGVAELRMALRLKEGGPHRLPATPLGKKLTQLEAGALFKLLRDEQKVVYGVDDRKDLFSVTDEAIRQDADAVVALFHAGDLKDIGSGRTRLPTELFGNAMGLCDTEPFRSQPIGPFGSGFLVTDRMVVTAGHCVSDEDLPGTRFVFGFRMLDELSPMIDIPTSEVYRGVEILHRVEEKGGADWAIVRLDRSVPNHTIAKIRRTGQIADGQLVHVIGHPCGLPLKYAGGANVRNNQLPSFFVANLDAFGGNSGSPVFNSDTHEVEGILVRGDADFVKRGNCRVSLVCPTTGCRGEDCTRTTEFASLIDHAEPIHPTATMSHRNVTKSAGSPLAAGEPLVYTHPRDGHMHVVYRGIDGNIYDIPLE
jgi:hypothetical protein